MSTGGGKINSQIQQQQLQAQQQQNQIFNKMLEETPEQKQWRDDSGKWREWLNRKDYSSAPEGSILNFNLWNPANVQKQAQRMADLEGIGALGLGGKGDSSIALGLAKERNANQAAELAGAEYENAVMGRNAYFEGNALPYMTAETNKLGNLLGDASNRSQYYTNANIQTQRRSLFPSLFGSALGAGSSILGNPGLFKN